MRKDTLVRGGVVALAAALAVAVVPAVAQTSGGPPGAGVPYRGTQAELQAIATATRGVWTDLPDVSDMRRSQIQWYGVPAAMVIEMDCLPSDRPVEEWTCEKMMLVMTAPAAPTNLDAFLLRTKGWLTYSAPGGMARLIRVEHHGPDKTQAQLWDDLIKFQGYTNMALTRIEVGNRDGW